MRACLENHLFNNYPVSVFHLVSSGFNHYPESITLVTLVTCHCIVLLGPRPKVDLLTICPGRPRSRKTEHNKYKNFVDDLSRVLLEIAGSTKAHVFWQGTFDCIMASCVSILYMIVYRFSMRLELDQEFVSAAATSLPRVAQRSSQDGSPTTSQLPTPSHHTHVMTTWQHMRMKIDVDI